MDFKQLLSVASNKQKVNEKELATTKKGINTTCSTKSNMMKKKVDSEKQKKLEAIRARVEAQFKPKNQEQKPKGDEEIMDFTITGLSENDIRRKKLSDAEKVKKQQEFMEKLKRLKERPVGSEENQSVKVKSHRTVKETSVKDEGKKDNDQQKKASAKTQEELKEEKRSSDSVKRHERDKSKHKSHKHHKEKHHSKSKEDTQKTEHSTISKPEWVSLKKEKPAPAVTPVKKKAPPKGPPPLSFTQLLSMAQENKNKPLVVTDAYKEQESADKPGKANKKKLREPDRPMTQEEKERFYRMQTPEYRRWLKYGGPRPPSVPSSVKRRTKGPKSRETIQNSSSDDDDEAKGSDKAARPSHSGDRHDTNISQVTSKLKHSRASSNNSLHVGEQLDKRISSDDVHKSLSGKQIREQKTKQPSSQMSVVQKKTGSLQKESENNSKQSKDQLKQKSKIEAQNPWDRIYGQIQKQNPKKVKKQRVDVIESDDEYDEDLDGFVVDGDDDFIDDSEAQDYSKYISEIFGYDKRKFRDMDDDDLSDMETGFAEQMKEEIRSAKIGLMEDLEDIKMEEEMKKKKLLKKKIRIH